MHTHSTRFLGDTGDRRLHLFACLHDEIAVLIDDDDDVRQELVMQAVGYKFIWIKTTSYELVIIILQVAHTGIHQQFIPVLHLNDKRVKRVDHAVAVGDDDLFRIGVRHGSQVVFQQRFIRCKLHHLRIHHDEF